MFEPLHRKPARFAKEIPDQTFLGERQVPAEHFIGLPAPGQSSGRIAPPGPWRAPPHLARGVPGRPESQPPTPTETHLRYLPEQSASAGQDETKPAWAYSSETPRGGQGVFSGDSQKVAPSGLKEKYPGQAAWWAVASFPGLRRPGRTGSALTSVKKLSIVPAQSRIYRVQLRLAEVSAAAGPGKPCVSRRHSWERAPAGLPCCHCPVPSCPSHLLFAQTQVSNSPVPTAAFVSSSSKFLTTGRSARERRTAGGTFFPQAGEGGGCWRARPPPSALRPGALEAGRRTAGRKVIRTRDLRASAPEVSSPAPRLSQL